jgi:hypothetical protein
MLTWLAVKTFFKKAWSYIKKYWKYFLAIFYGMGVWLYFRGQSENVREVLDVANDSHKKELEVINNIHKEEVEKRDNIIKKYTGILDIIEEEYESRRKFLDVRKKKEIKKLVEENIDNPSELAKLISDRFDIIYVAGGETE